MESNLVPSKPSTKTNWVLLIVVIVVALIVIGFTWSFMLGCPFQKVANPFGGTTVDQSTGVVPAATSDEEAAQTVLEKFFTFASSGNFVGAAALLEPMVEGGEVATSWDDMPGLGIDNPPEDHGEILEIYCDTFETCLAVEVLETKLVDTGTYEFKVQFLNPDGTVFELGPYCGDTGPPSLEFTYFVKKINGEWKVITAPLYHP